MLPDYTTLDADDLEALQGLDREGYFAWKTGRADRLAEIAEAAGGSAAPDIETKVKPRPRGRRAS